MRPCRTPTRPALLLTLTILFAALSAAASSPPASTAAPEKPLDFGTLLLALAQRTVSAPQPSVPEPRRPSLDRDARTGFSGKASDGKGKVDFPLQHTQVYAQISGNVARVEVTQLYKNPTANKLEAVYAFPLPPNAAVTDMYFRIGKRIVYGEVQRREQARRTYEEAKSEGKTAALTEQERPNLFTQSVANIPPGETIAVVLRYVHEVPFDDGRYLFHFPTTIGPRYIPGDAIGHQGPGEVPDTTAVPDASRITPPVSVPDEHNPHDVEILVRIAPGAAFKDLASKNHRIVSGMDGEGSRLVGLAEDDRVPNKDFVLSYRPASAQPEAHALAQREKGDDYLMLFVQPPAEVQEKDVRPREMVFLLDKSGSMSGEPIETAKAVVVQALHRMGPEDTFQLVAFDSAPETMSPRPLTPTPENVAAAEAWLGTLQGSNGTEMLAGIRAALSAPTDPKRLRMVIFCTDGFIGNEAEIIDTIEKSRNGARVFGFGIGTSVNRYLIDGVARAGRGTSEVVGVRESPDEAVARLYKRLDRPLLTDLSVSFDGITVSDAYPERMPDLFAGQPLVVVGRYAGAGPASMTLKGRLGDKPFQRKINLEVQKAGDERPVLGTLWARRRIDDLSFRHSGAPRPEDAEQIAQLGLRFKLVTAYTSFVAVERELLADPGLPLTQVLVPNELPDGSFGNAATSAQVLPSRVKPGDPEVRIHAPATARRVEVALPFEDAPRAARFDPVSGEFVLRFLVPPGWADGSYEAKVTTVHQDGHTEQSAVPIRVDTTPAAIAVVFAPDRVAPGERLALSFKPALPLSRLADLVTHPTPGGLGAALKGAMEVKEILIRAPWGELRRARLTGALGLYQADLTVPTGWPAGAVKLEVVASDAAGNISRRNLEVRVGGAPSLPVAPLAAALLGLLGLAAFAALRRLPLRALASKPS